MIPSRRDAYRRLAWDAKASCMSDARWRKVLGAIADAELGLCHASWKFLDSDQLHDWGVPDRNHILPSRLADGRFQPEEYRWIEWIHFPRSWHPDPASAFAYEQDLEGLKRVLDSVGKLQVREDERGLTLFGYVR
ncbi:hypothetical protein [Planctomyces sp. SH-PL62]|uniref:hypothetical protein n=1 Tax=Planctomyces sp. SH-PL62 TaxID=1636152 RepID=UPI00078BF100|nr:hypothetical protein [Planctomyces sp. SH-PL62]AMV40599.1 hypothetical protein VT85_24425 [Planctomyces sp. SH-PL62]